MCGCLNQNFYIPLFLFIFHWLQKTFAILLAVRSHFVWGLFHQDELYVASCSIRYLVSFDNAQSSVEEVSIFVSLGNARFMFSVVWTRDLGFRSSVYKCRTKSCVVDVWSGVAENFILQFGIRLLQTKIVPVYIWINAQLIFKAPRQVSASDMSISSNK